MSKNYDEHTEAVLYNPEITAERLQTARPFREMFPKLTKKLKAEIVAEKQGRGRPRLKHPKDILTLRVDRRVTEHFKHMGGRWRAKMSKAPEDAILTEK